MSTIPFRTDRGGEPAPVINHGQLGFEIVAQKHRVAMLRQRLDREEAQLAALLEQERGLDEHRARAAKLFSKEGGR